MSDVADNLPAPLALVGLEAGDERVYRGVLRASGASRGLLSEITGLRPGELGAHLDRLEAAGLVQLRDEHVTAVRPDEAIGAVIERESERLQHAGAQVEALRNLLPSLIADHVRSGRPGAQAVAVEAVQGVDVARLLRSLAEDSEGDLLWFRPDQWRLPVTHDVDALVTELVRGGRRSRAIYPSRVLEEAPDVVRRRAEAGEQVRIVASLPVRVAVVGSGAALVPDRWGGNTGRRLVVREHSLVGALTALFDHVWDQAMAVPGLGSVEDPAGSRRLLLHELAHGAKDEQIARALGVSLRTVRRRIADTMAELGADSRFQAGVEAVRRGWL
jgi:DNA-binding transcriptional ArsR family regulator